ncbi:LysM peptidoglycan-binding domain-containing protein [candidate division KSB1 bacterium]|nr:LysM peptidoglycan-binding domain-containing protein [candidate division KSB1 bacterium]
MAGSTAAAKMVILTWVWALFITLIVTQTRVNRSSLRFPEFDPLYVEVAKTNGEEETEGIVESTDQELNMQTLLSLMEEEQAPKVEENAMTLEDDILPEPETTRETVVYTVQPDDCLYKIAAIFYGDLLAYSKIVEDNPLVIENPDQIEAGQKLLITIPKGMPVSYTVKEGESLSKIANRFYGDPMKFKDIFLANQDAIEDPDIIWPGQVLKIFLTEN